MKTIYLMRHSELLKPINIKNNDSLQLQNEKWSYCFQNFHLLSDKYNQGFYAKDNFEIQETEYDKYINIVEQSEFKKIFDTKKTDYQYSIGDMKSRIQLQEIENIGLLLYYDNPDLYELLLKEQRIKLIDELNTYGFSFKYNDLGLDKLRTLYYKKEMYSENQNS